MGNFRKFLGTNFGTRVVQVYCDFLAAYGSGCGTVGRPESSDARGPGFKSSHWQLLLNVYLLFTVCRKDGHQEKEAYFVQKSKVKKLKSAFPTI